MFREIPVNVPGVFAIKASGKLTDEDYEAFLPRLEALIREHGKISLLVELEDFEGWEAKAARDDLDFGLEHDRDFERIAIVGDKSWQHWMILLSNLFVHTPLRFFPREETARAWEWLSESTQGDEPVAAYRQRIGNPTACTRVFAVASSRSTVCWTSSRRGWSAPWGRPSGGKRWEGIFFGSEEGQISRNRQQGNRGVRSRQDAAHQVTR